MNFDQITSGLNVSSSLEQSLDKPGVCLYKVQVDRGVNTLRVNLLILGINSLAFALCRTEETRAVYNFTSFDLRSDEVSES